MRKFKFLLMNAKRKNGKQVNESVNESVNECETKKRKQVDISSFFGGAAKQKRAETFTSSSKTSQPVTTSRTLQAATAEKWKTTRLPKYNAEQWLEQYVFAVLNVYYDGPEAEGSLFNFARAQKIYTHA